MLNCPHCDETVHPLNSIVIMVPHEADISCQDTPARSWVDDLGNQCHALSSSETKIRLETLRPIITYHIGCFKVVAGEEFIPKDEASWD